MAMFGEHVKHDHYVTHGHVNAQVTSQTHGHVNAQVTSQTSPRNTNA
mgnify:FL=1